jgi:hypothetical protein
MLPEDFLIENAGCERKYISVKAFEPSDCPKERILLAWDYKLKMIEKIQVETSKNTSIAPEPHQTGDLFGCYDNLCCTAAYNTIANKSIYLKLIAAFLVFTGIVSAIGFYNIYVDLENKKNNNLNSYYGENLNEIRGKSFYSLSNFVIILLVLAFIGVIVFGFYTLPQKPKRDPSSVISPYPSQNNKISSDLIINFDLNKTVFNLTKLIRDEIKKETKFDENKDCGVKCPIIRYNFELSSEDGSFIRNKTADWKNLIMKQDGKIGNKYIVEFEGGSRVLDTFTENFEFVHKCPMLPSKIQIKITGEVNPAPTAFIQNKIRKISISKKTNEKQNSNNDTYNFNQFEKQDSSSAILNSKIIDYSKLNIGEKFEVMNKTIDFSFVSQESQVIKGKVFKRIDARRNQAINSTEVIIQNLDFPQCESYTLNTDGKGEFISPKLFIFGKGLKSKYSVIVYAPDLTQYKNTIVTEKIGASAEIDLGYIELWSPSMLEMADISATALNSVNNKPLENVKVSIYQGFLSFDNEESAEKPISSKNSFLEIKNKEEAKATLLQINQMEFYQVYKASLSNYQGVYEIKELPPNLYTLVFEKEGFYREILSNFYSN